MDPQITGFPGVAYVWELGGREESDAGKRQTAQEPGQNYGTETSTPIARRAGNALDIDPWSLPNARNVSQLWKIG